MRGLASILTTMLLALSSPVASASAVTESTPGGGYTVTGPDRRNLSISAKDSIGGGGLGAGVVQLVHYCGNAVLGRFNGGVTCSDVGGDVACATGVIKNG